MGEEAHALFTDGKLRPKKGPQLSPDSRRAPEEGEKFIFHLGWDLLPRRGRPGLEPGGWGGGQAEFLPPLPRAGEGPLRGSWKSCRALAGLQPVSLTVLLFPGLPPEHLTLLRIDCT